LHCVSVNAVPALPTAERLAGDAIHWAWQQIVRRGAIRAGQRRAEQFAGFGADSTIAFPPAALHGESRIAIGPRTIIGPHATVSAGMPGEPDDGGDPIVTIGDRCVLGKGIAVVAHRRVDIGDDTWTGHYVYITEQNHGYENVDVAIGKQWWKEAPVRIGADCWIGHGAVILPGTTTGRHVVVAAGAVVAGLEVPDCCVVAGVPARVVRRYVPGRGWVRIGPDGTPAPD
jgi:carbonic anhydrase/acetyltransferase-like protein (isoleucine patch superfamily)